VVSRNSDTQVVGGSPPFSRARPEVEQLAIGDAGAAASAVLNPGVPVRDMWARSSMIVADCQPPASAMASGLGKMPKAGSMGA